MDGNGATGGRPLAAAGTRVVGQVSEVAVPRRADFSHPGPDDSAEDWVAWANALPAFRALRMTCLELSESTGRFEIPVDPPFPVNANGALNGGYLASAVDQALGALGGRATPFGQLAVTGSLTVQYLLPAFPPLTLSATVRHAGRRVLFVEAVVEDAGHRRCATAVGTMFPVGHEPSTGRGPAAC